MLEFYVPLTRKKNDVVGIVIYLKAWFFVLFFKLVPLNKLKHAIQVVEILKG
jgi:hypothetical protein